MANKGAKSSRNSRAGKQRTMMSPVSALHYLASRKRKLNLYSNDKKEDARYGFRIGEYRFLLRPNEKIEVIDAVPACPVPNTPAWFSGMINLRGNLLPVFDIRQLLGLDTAGPGRWIMVFGQGNRTAGIYADSLPTAVIPEHHCDAPAQLPEILQGCVEKTLMQENNIWFEAAFENIFGNLRYRF